MKILVIKKDEFIKIGEDSITLLGVNIGKDFALGIIESKVYREGVYRSGNLIFLGEAKVKMEAKSLMSKKIRFFIEAPLEVKIILGRPNANPNAEAKR